MGVLCGVTSTLTGFGRRMVAASLVISSGIVALKNRFWRFCGSNATTLRISWINPMSNMRSASSSTKNSRAFRETAFCPIRSSRRPGVATSTSTPRIRLFFWEASPTPPKMQVVEIAVNWAYCLKQSATWMASSRVGSRIKARQVLGARNFPESKSNCKIGRANAAVFPVPVWAIPSKSQPSNRLGMDCSWIGVGCS